MMRPKNTGKPSEKAFNEHLMRTRGKTYFLHRLTDAADVRGRTGKTGFQAHQPSDYVSVIDGVTAFTEIKSTENEPSFPFGLLKTTQHSMAARIDASQGNYVVFVHRLTTGEWFRIPYGNIERTRVVLNKQSMTWDDMKAAGLLWT